MTTTGRRAPAPRNPTVPPEIIRPFPLREFIERLHRVQAVMAERDYEALVVADPANLYYLTGYNAWSFYTPQVLVVPLQGVPHLFARAMDAQGAHYTAALLAQVWVRYRGELGAVPLTIGGGPAYLLPGRVTSAIPSGSPPSTNVRTTVDEPTSIS